MKKLPILLLSLLLLVVLFSFCNNKNTKLKKTMDTNDFSTDWRMVDSLERKGLPKSALEKVDDIYAKAIKKNNQPQQAKCLIFKGKFMTQLEEDGFVKAINQFVLDEEEAKAPMKSMIQSMLAEQYSSFLQRNYYRFNNRTETPDFKTDDIRTWTIGQLSAESRKFFLKSVEDEATRNIKIQEWDEIIRGGKNSDNLRPTLYDFLANRAMDFLMNERNYLTEPVYKFYVDQPEAFADAKEFSQFNFQTKDSSSAKYQTVLLFQKMIAHHLNDDMPDALIDVDLKRLRFVRENGVIDGKDELYFKALENIATKYDDYEASTEVQYWMARFYMDKGAQYQPNPQDVGKFDLKKAYEICEKAIQKSTDSYGGKQCRNLQIQIERKNLSVQMEKVNLRNEPMLASISYKNVGKLYGKIIRLEEKDRREMRDLQNQNKLIPFLNDLKPVKTWTTDLPQVGDYRDHVVEVKVDAMPLGFYLVMMSDNSEFSDEKKAVSYLSIHVSNISFWTRRDKFNQNEFYVVHRKTGKPLNQVKANYFIRDYNSQSRKYVYIDRGEGLTDQDGYLKPMVGDRDHFQIRWSKGDDKLNLEESYSNYSYRNHRQKRKQISFFLDRAIYRPGQTVYFKGLLTEVDVEQMPKILPNEKVEVIFYDVNSQEVEKKTFITNEFGTFNGSFQAPRSGLLGRMRIQASGLGSKYFRVEEYKRPKFEVTFDPVKGSFKIGEEVKVTGHAKAFAGSNVDGAKVTYRVVRETVYPYWRWGWRFFPPSESMEITNGETMTDAEGKYNIAFTAVPDRSADARNKPQFTYRVYADVVDITGETHSSETFVSVGHIALSINISIPDKIERGDLQSKEFKISSKNLNGEFENSLGEIAVYQLQSPKGDDGVLRGKYFPKPDQFLMTFDEFKKDFPNDIYHEENILEKMEEGKEVFKTRFDASQNPTFVFGNSNLNLGAHVLVLKTKDKYGQEIEIKKYFTIYDLEGKLPANIISFHEIEKNKYEPGEVAKYYFGSAYDSIKVLHEVEFKNEIIKREWLALTQVKELQMRIEEEHRGNIGYHLSFVKENRKYTTTKTINVPWTNKDLKFEYSTFRDKLKPGQEEEWRVKISGNKKDKVAAEMVAAMYDASLDQFAPNYWNLNMYPTQSANKYLRSGNFGSTYSQLFARNWHERGVDVNRSYRYLDWFGFSMDGFLYRNRMMKSSRRNEGMVMDSAPAPMSAEPEMAEMAVESDGITMANGDYSDQEVIEEVSVNMGGEGKEDDSDFSDVKVRTNLNETVFFMPELMTDENGDVIIKFTMNEALTRWKFLGMAHTKDLKFGITQNEIVTQKELMVMPNAPRFMREGDMIEYSAKVSNLTEKELSGTAKLELFDAVTNEPINLFIERKSTTLPFTVGAGQSVPLSWKLKIPFGKVMAITHRVVAQAGDFSDGEESSLPVLTNRMLVTETMPLPVRGNETKTFSFDRMKNGNSSTLQNHELTLEFTSNPAWYAVQALPYLMEYPHACTEQIFSRYYANSLATNVANSHPKVKTIFEKWKNTDAMLSNLSKNQELKSALLEETPWVLAAQSEEQQKKNIGLLFDLNRMSQERTDAVATIAERQLSNGGFSWFPGGRDSWYITQYIVEGMGHLNELGVDDIKSDPKVQKMLNRAIIFIDARIAEQYEELLKRVKEGKTKLEDDHLNNMAVHYLYARSFFTNQQMDGNPQIAHDYYLNQAEKYWLNKGMYQEGMLALALHRNGKKSVTDDMIKSFKERSLNNDEMGMYWKYDRGYFWYQLPIETHALMIEVFDEVANDSKAVDDLKVWLLKAKQTTHWKTTKATSAAVYALLRTGANWLLEDTPLEITLGDKKIDQSKMDAEAGTGYFKMKWSGEEVTTSMADVKVENPNSVVAWGALYWQYFEDLDKVTSFEDTPLKLRKKLFKVVNSDRGPVMTELKEGSQLSLGDKLHVRIELRVDRPMEYVHMKDMRASGFEPLNVLSQYKWQGGLGYYESTKDASTNFFISYLPKGTFVFEYPMVVNHKGDFSNGVTTIECMYAPEFTSHSEGIQVKVQ